MHDLPKRHQHSIVPQTRDTQGQYRPKPGQQRSSLPPGAVGKPQQLASMPLSTLGPVKSA